MKTAELEAEMRQAVANLTSNHVEMLLSAGVPLILIIVCQLVGVERVSATAEGCYCPDPGGARTSRRCAYITPVRVQSPDAPQWTEPWGSARRGGDLVDLIAWRLDEPDC